MRLPGDEYDGQQKWGGRINEDEDGTNTPQHMRPTALPTSEKRVASGWDGKEKMKTGSGANAHGEYELSMTMKDQLVFCANHQSVLTLSERYEKVASWADKVYVRVCMCVRRGRRRI